MILTDPHNNDRINLIKYPYWTEFLKYKNVCIYAILNEYGYCSVDMAKACQTDAEEVSEKDK
jgi:hypothetical protein